MPTQLIAENTIPNFLLKLWKLVEDEQYRQCIQWDDTGFSFHVREPYSFSKCVLPLYFKHSNLNSFIRQLNMYGFRKVTNLDKGSLKQPTDHRDTLEFQHPYFVRGHVELLQYIKRKVSNTKGDMNDTNPLIGAVGAYAAGIGDQQQCGNDSNKELSHVLGDIRGLRDKQATMDARLNQMKKENQTVWREISRMRQLHMKQQQVVNKLIQLLLSLVQPGANNRLGKRQLLAIGPAMTTVNDQTKRSKTNGDHCIDVTSQINQNLIQGESNSTSDRNAQLIIADVTDEFEPERQIHSQQYSDRRNSSGTLNANQIPIISVATNSSGEIQADIKDAITGSYPPVEQLTLLETPIVSSAQDVVAKRQNGVCVSSPLGWAQNDSSPVSQPEFAEYLDFIQSDLDSLKTVLTADTFNLDQDTLSNLFTMADETNNMMAAIQTLKNAPIEFTMNTEIVGNEMQVYKPPEVLVPPDGGASKQPRQRKCTAGDGKPSLPPLAPLPPSLQSFQRLNDNRPSLPSITPLPPIPPNRHCFQRQSSVPVYYGQGSSRMADHFSGPMYQNLNCPSQSYTSSQQSGLRQISESSNEQDDSNLVLSHLFAEQAAGDETYNQQPLPESSYCNPEPQMDTTCVAGNYNNVRNVFLKGRSRSYIN